MAKKPNSRRNLDVAIDRQCSSQEDAVRVRRLLANAIVGQMLPPGAVKGGTALKLRFGHNATRMSADLDCARSADLDMFVAELSKALEEGWEGFSGYLVRCDPASPEGVPSSYVMQPYDVKLAYNGKAWMTVSLEIGHNEIGDAEEPDIVVPSEASAVLESIGFPALKPVALMRIDHQIAQKLHAVSARGSQRAHDLIDLQIIAANSELDLGLVRQTCARLFDYRRAHAWPPAVEAGAEWDSLYSEQARGLPVLQNVDAAVEWCNGFIDEIERAGLELEGPMEEDALELGDDRIAAARDKVASVNESREHQPMPRGKGHDEPEL